MEELKLVNQRIAIESIPKEKLTYTPQNDSINLSLNDTRKVWSKGIVPDLPDFSGIISSSKQNGSSNTIEQPFLTSREVMKIKVIQGTVNKPDFTYGKLARLGCSSEGFVTGKNKLINIFKTNITICNYCFCKIFLSFQIKFDVIYGQEY